VVHQRWDGDNCGIGIAVASPLRLLGRDPPLAGPLLRIETGVGIVSDVTKDRLEGTVDNTTGDVKSAVRKATGAPQTQAEGESTAMVDQAKDADSGQ